MEMIRPYTVNALRIPVRTPDLSCMHRIPVLGCAHRKQLSFHKYELIMCINCEAGVKYAGLMGLPCAFIKMFCVRTSLKTYCRFQFGNCKPANGGKENVKIS